MDPRISAALMLLTMAFVLGLLLRWTFGHRGRVPGGGPPLGTGEEFTPVRVVPTFVEAEMMRLDLVDHGVEAELGRRGSQASVLVRARDLHRAADVLADYT